MKDRPVVRIEVEYDDGEVRGSSGEDADAIFNMFLKALNFYLRMQKRSYEGPTMHVLREAHRDDVGDTSGDGWVRRTLSELI